MLARPDECAARRAPHGRCFLCCRLHESGRPPCSAGLVGRGMCAAGHPARRRLAAKGEQLRGVGSGARIRARTARSCAHAQPGWAGGLGRVLCRPGRVRCSGLQGRLQERLLAGPRTAASAPGLLWTPGKTGGGAGWVWECVGRRPVQAEPGLAGTAGRARCCSTAAACAATAAASPFNSACCAAFAPAAPAQRAVSPRLRAAHPAAWAVGPPGSAPSSAASRSSSRCTSASTSTLRCSRRARRAALRATRSWRGSCASDPAARAWLPGLRAAAFACVGVLLRAGTHLSICFMLHWQSWVRHRLG